MWKYGNQIRIRWISLIIGLICLILLLIVYHKDIPSTLTGLKVLTTRLQIGFENLPFWYYIVIIIFNILLMLIGIPSLFIALPLMIVKNTTFVFVVTALCQFIATLIAMWLSYKTSFTDLPDNLKERVEVNKEKYQKFAFWSRLFYNIPLRTIDSLTPLIHDNQKTFCSSLIPAASGIMIRICIPILFIKFILAQFTILEPNPALEHSKLFIWTIVLITYTIITKVPELRIGPKDVKNVIIEIEAPSMGKPILDTDSEEND